MVEMGVKCINRLIKLQNSSLYESLGQLLKKVWFKLTLEIWAPPNTKFFKGWGKNLFWHQLTLEMLDDDRCKYMCFPLSLVRVHIFYVFKSNPQFQKIGDNLENSLDQHRPIEFSRTMEMSYICVVHYGNS